MHPNDDVNRVAVVERRVPDRDARRGRVDAHRRARSCPRVGALRDTLDAQGARVRRHREDRPHAPAGRDAAHARPGVLRLGRAARRTRVAAHRRARCRTLYELALGGTAVGTGLNAHPRVMRERVAARARASSPACRSSPRRTSSRRSPAHDALVARARRAQDARASPASKIANDVRWLASGPRCGHRRARDPRERARQLDHAGQGEPDAVRGADDGLRAGDGQRRRGRHRRQRAATSSSTSTSR